MCPKLCAPSRCPPEHPELGLSQPRHRELSATSSARCVNSLAVSALANRPVPPSRQVNRSWQKRARSKAVEKSPACPATPPSQRAFSSCTSPCQARPSRAALHSVGTISARGILVGRKRVRVNPRGAHTSLSNNASSGASPICSKSAPRTIAPMSEYTVSVPGAQRSGLLHTVSRRSGADTGAPRSKRLPAGSPEQCASRCLIVTCARSGLPSMPSRKAGRRSITRASRSRCPVSWSRMASEVELTTLVSDARSNRWSARTRRVHAYS